MLYDNAQLLRTYVHWVGLGGNEVLSAGEAADVAARTAVWLLESLGLGSGNGNNTNNGTPLPEALASSLDAASIVDGERHEGASYLWTIEGLQDVLGAADGAAAARLMNVGREGTVSAYGSPLHPALRLDESAAKLWARVRPTLLAARRQWPQDSNGGRRRRGSSAVGLSFRRGARAPAGRPAGWTGRVPFGLFVPGPGV